MRTLYHLWLNPFCRKVRLILNEKNIEFCLSIENIWERRESFLALNPVGDVPVFVEEQGTALSGSNVISEYIDEAFPNPPLIGSSPMERAETRRLVYWFDQKFGREVTKNIVDDNSALDPRCTYVFFIDIV